MEITYLNHSGFVIRLEKVALLIDYFGEGSPVLEEVLADRSRKLYVLASHSHADHFDSSILSFGDSHGNAVYVLSSDIRGANSRLGVLSWPVNYLAQGDTYSDENLRIWAFGSTDQGISFLVEADGRKIFHAGDLNNWHWNEECGPDEADAFEANYLAELEKLALHSPEIYAVMFPVDPRLGKDFMRGPQQFVERIKTAHFFPMHFGTGYSKVGQFKPYAKEYGAKFYEITKTGQTFNL